MEYEWWIGAGPFLERSAIAPWEVMEVLYSPKRWRRAALTSHGLPILAIWGRTDEGRPLVVILRHMRTFTDRWQILLAAPMGPRQLAEFTAWEADR